MVRWEGEEQMRGVEASGRQGKGGGTRENDIGRHIAVSVCRT